MFILVLKGKSHPGLSAISTERLEAVDKKYCVTRCLVPGLVFPVASLVSRDPSKVGFLYLSCHVMTMISVIVFH